MADTTGSSSRPHFFKSIQSVLPSHGSFIRHHHDEEGTYTPGPASSLPPQLLEPPSDKTRKKGDLVSSADQLALFRSLVGIDNPPGLHASTFFRSGRPAPNLGIYARVVAAESKAGSEYKIFSTFISFCIGAQVLVAACLTALGAGNGPHGAVTAFGALNTVLAGFRSLAYFKGSGLPNRMKYYKNEWTKIREYIEQRERDFCRQDCTRNLEAEIRTIEKMFEAVKADVEANTPDSFVSIRDISRRDGAVNPGPTIAKGAEFAVDAAADRVRDRIVDPAERSVDGLRRNLSYQSSHFNDRLSTYADKAATYENRAAGYAEKAAGYADKAAGYSEKVSSFVEKPHMVGLTLDPTLEEHSSPRDVPPPEHRTGGDHMV